MNRTALAVVALAVGAVLIIGLYNIYKPQTNDMVHDVFDKIRVTDMMRDNPSNSGSHSHNHNHNANHHHNVPDNQGNNPDNPGNLPSNKILPSDWNKGVNVRIETHKAHRLLAHKENIHNEYDYRTYCWLMSNGSGIEPDYTIDWNRIRVIRHESNNPEVIAPAHQVIRTDNDYGKYGITEAEWRGELNRSVTIEIRSLSSNHVLSSQPDARDVDRGEFQFIVSNINWNHHKTTFEHKNGHKTAILTFYTAE